MDGTLVPTRDRSITKQSETSHVPGWSSRYSGCESHGCYEGPVGVEQRAVLSAVVEAAGQIVEQVSESRSVAFSAGASSVAVGAWGLSARGGEGPHVSGGGQTLILDRSGDDDVAAAMPG